MTLMALATASKEKVCAVSRTRCKSPGQDWWPARRSWCRRCHHRHRHIENTPSTPVGDGCPVLEVDGVAKVYQSEPPVTAQRDVSFSVARCELVGIVGPSLLHLMGTLDRPNSSQVRIAALDIEQLSDREQAVLPTQVEQSGSVAGNVYRNPLVPSIDINALSIAATSLGLLDTVGTSHRAVTSTRRVPKSPSPCSARAPPNGWALTGSSLVSGSGSTTCGSTWPGS
jgi:hypothetical protein